MAYKQNPGRENLAKTGHGVPAPFKQMETIKKIGNKIYEGGKWLADAAEGRHGSANYSQTDSDMRIKNLPSVKNKKTKEVKKEVKKPAPVKQMKTIKKVYNKAKEIVSNVGDKISNANAAGVKAFDEGISADNFATGSGAMRSYKKDGLDYVKGFAKSIVSGDNPKTSQKKKSPMKQGLNFSTKEDMAKSGAKPYKGSDRQKANEKANETRKASPAKQLGRQAVTKVSAKKAPAKMKSC